MANEIGSRSSLVVRHRNQPIAGNRQVELLLDDPRHVLGTHQSGQAVAAQQEDIAAPDRLHRHLHLDVRFRAKGLQDDVAALAERGFLFGQLTGLDELLHQRLVLRELGRGTIAQEVRAAVPDLRYVERVLEQCSNSRGRAHPAQLGLVHCLLEDRPVGLFRGPRQFLDQVGRGDAGLTGQLLAQVPEHDVDRGGGRHFAGGRASHPVGNHEQRRGRIGGLLDEPVEAERLALAQVDDDERVFIVIARAADVRLREHLDHHG